MIAFLSQVAAQALGQYAGHHMVKAHERLRKASGRPQPAPRRNPAPRSAARKGSRKTAAGRAPRGSSGDRRQLAQALALSRRFHGAGRGAVVRLGRGERRPGDPRYGVLVGSVGAIEYQAPGGSKRGGWRWRHRSGDRGPGHPSSPNRPALVAFPGKRTVAVVQGKSPMRFSSQRGLVG